jgi:hypothetical protein
LALAHGDLADKIAGNFARRTSHPFEDLRQLAMIGLLKAALRFDGSGGRQFRPYGRTFANGEITHYLRDHGYAIKVPPTGRGLLHASGKKLLRQGVDAAGVLGRLGIRSTRWWEICGACSVRVVALGVEEVDGWKLLRGCGGHVTDTLTLGQGFILSHTINAPFPTPLLQHLAPGFLIGSLLIGTGNVFGKLRSNRLIGIRSPWTLSSDRVWDQTHRFAGRSFVLGGALLIAGAAFPGGEPWQEPMIAAVLVVMIGSPYLKSYWLWRKEVHQS